MKAERELSQTLNEKKTEFMAPKLRKGVFDKMIYMSYRSMNRKLKQRGSVSR